MKHITSRIISLFSLLTLVCLSSNLFAQIPDKISFPIHDFGIKYISAFSKKNGYLINAEAKWNGTEFTKVFYKYKFGSNFTNIKEKQKAWMITDERTTPFLIDSDGNIYILYMEDKNYIYIYDNEKMSGTRYTDISSYEIDQIYGWEIDKDKNIYISCSIDKHLALIKIDADKDTKSYKYLGTLPSIKNGNCVWAIEPTVVSITEERVYLAGYKVADNWDNPSVVIYKYRAEDLYFLGIEHIEIPFARTVPTIRIDEDEKVYITGYKYSFENAPFKSLFMDVYTIEGDFIYDIDLAESAGITEINNIFFTGYKDILITGSLDAMSYITTLHKPYSFTDNGYSFQNTKRISKFSADNK